MELVLSIFLMVANMLAHGKMTCNMDLELKHGLILLSMKADLRLDRDIVLVLFILLMEVNMSVSLLQIKYKVRALMNGKMEGSFKDFGRVIK